MFDMIADMISYEKLNPIFTELIIRGRKLNISLVFITQSYFEVATDVKLKSTHCCVIRIPNKRELQSLSDIIFKDFIRFIMNVPMCETIIFLS